MLHDVAPVNSVNGQTGDVVIAGADVLPDQAGHSGEFLTTDGSNLSWGTPAGSGDVVKVGTPVNNQLGVWTGNGTIEGDAALTFDTSTDILSSGGLNLSGLTASEILATDGSKNLVSLAVATYPSLAELAYVKGATSAIQTQLDAKQPLDSDLTTLAGLTATTNNFIVSVSSAWASRTPAQVRATLDLEAGTDFYSIAATDSAIDTDIATHAALTATHGVSGAIVGTTDTQTLTGKTIDAASNTISNLAVSHFAGSAIVTEGEGLASSDNDTSIPTTAAVIDYVASAGTGATTELDNLGTTAINAHLLFDTDAAYDIGSTTVGINDLHLGSGGVINFDGGDVILTHTANTLTFTGGTVALGTATATGGITGDLTGNVTGNVSGTAATVTGAAQTAITSLGTLTALQVDNININGNTISSTAGTDLLITPLAGQQLILDGTIEIDAGVVTGATSITSTAFVGALTGNADTVTGFTPASGSLTLAGADALTLTTSAATDVTLPTTGTLATLAGTEELDNKTLDSSVGKGTWTASGTWTLPVITLGGDATLSENVSIVLDAALSADGKYCGITEAGTAGATLAFGDVVYLAAADSRWELADASAAATSGDVKIGICVLAAASDGQPTVILLWGKIRADAAFPSMTISAPLYISETAGDITGTQPTTTDAVIRRIGFANTADELFFCPSNDYITHT